MLDKYTSYTEYNKNVPVGGGGGGGGGVGGGGRIPGATALCAVR